MQYSNLLSQDISYDRDSDLYRPLFGGSCGPGYYPNNNNNYYNNNNNIKPSSGQGCARIWRAQNRLTSLAARESLSARDAAECERMCGTAATYSCRSFSFASGNSWSSGAFSGYSAAAASSCQLSDLGESELRGGDMETDYTSDVFIMGDPASCGSGAPAASSSSFISKGDVGTSRSIFNMAITRVFQLRQAGSQDRVRADQALPARPGRGGLRGDLPAGDRLRLQDLRLQQRHLHRQLRQQQQLRPLRQGLQRSGIQGL